jgi:hypothetical protein
MTAPTFQTFFATAALICMIVGNPSPLTSKRILYILLTANVAIAWANLFLQAQP